MAIALPTALLGALGRRQWPARPAAFVCLGLLLLSAGVSEVTNGWAGGSLRAISTFLPPVLSGLLTVLSVSSGRRLRYAASVIVWCMTGLTALSIYSFYTGYDAQRYVMQEYGTAKEAPGEIYVPADHVDEGILFRIRSVGLLADPNDFSQMMVVALALLFGLYSGKRDLRRAAALCTSTFVLIWGLYLTHSRGSLIGLGLAIIVGLLQTLGLARASAMLALGAITAKILDFTGGRAISDAGESAAHRIDYWNLGLHLLAKHPLFGIGFGNFENANTMTGQTAHNTFMLCAAELGFVGLFFFISLLVFSFRSVSDAINSTALAEIHSERRLANGLRAALAGFLGCAWFLSRTYDPLLYILLGLCLACGGAAGRTNSDNRPWMLTSGLWSLATLVLLYAFVIGQRIAGH